MVTAGKCPQESAMRTDEAVRQIPAYLIGDLTPKEQAILEGHLDVNEEAQWWHARWYRQLLPVLKQPEAQPSPGVVEDLIARGSKMIQEGKEVQPTLMRAIRNEMWTYRKVAAALVIAAGIGVGLMVAGGKNPPPVALGTITISSESLGPERTNQVTSGHSVKVPTDGTASLRLPDGVTVHLAGGTEARFVEKWNAEGWLNIELQRGSVLIDGSPRTGNTGRFVSVRTPDGTYEAKTRDLADPPVLTAVSYYGPVYSIERRSDRIHDVDFQRQQVGTVLDAASAWGQTISYDPAIAEQYIDVKGTGLDFKGFLNALKSAGIDVVSTGGNTWTFRDGTASDMGRRGKSELFDVTVFSGGAEVLAGEEDSQMLRTHDVGFSEFSTRIASSHRGGAFRDPNGTVHFETPTTGDNQNHRHENDLLKLFPVEKLPLRGTPNSGVIEVLRRVSKPATAVVTVVPQGTTLMAQMDDSEKLIQRGDRGTFGSIQGTVVHVSPDGVVVRDSEGTYHWFTPTSN